MKKRGFFSGSSTSPEHSLGHLCTVIHLINALCSAHVSSGSRTARPGDQPPCDDDVARMCYHEEDIAAQRRRMRQEARASPSTAVAPLSRSPAPSSSLVPRPAAAALSRLEPAVHQRHKRWGNLPNFDSPQGSSTTPVAATGWTDAFVMIADDESPEATGAAGTKSVRPIQQRVEVGTTRDETKQMPAASGEKGRQPSSMQSCSDQPPPAQSLRTLVSSPSTRSTSANVSGLCKGTTSGGMPHDAPSIALSMFSFYSALMQKARHHCPFLARSPASPPQSSPPLSPQDSGLDSFASLPAAPAFGSHAISFATPLPATTPVPPAPRSDDPGDGGSRSHPRSPVIRPGSVIAFVKNCSNLAVLISQWRCVCRGTRTKQRSACLRGYRVLTVMRHREA